jgi:hypothetical protein
MNVMDSNSNYECAERATTYYPARRACISLAEWELSSFINSVMNLLSSEHCKLLKEIWLDELASMPSMPGPSSPDWGLVSIGATARLTSWLVDLAVKRASDGRI